MNKNQLHDLNDQEKTLPYSIIVPVYNDARGIEITLQSLTNQTYPSDAYEIIVVDNGSTDNTLEVVEKYRHSYANIKVNLEKEIKSSYAARNKGISISRGEYIAFIDADMSVDEDWLSNIDTALKKEEIDYMGYNVQIYSQNSSAVELYNVLTGFPIREYIKNDHFSPTCCLVAKRELFKEVGNFDSRLISSGDLDFGKRSYKKGYHLKYEPGITSYHPARSSAKSLKNKYFRIGRGFFQLVYYNPSEYNYMKRDIWNLRLYLPLRPKNYFIYMQNEYPEFKNLSGKDKWSLYVLNWLQRISMQSGYLYQAMTWMNKEKE